MDLDRINLRLMTVKLKEIKDITVKSDIHMYMKFEVNDMHISGERY